MFVAKQSVPPIDFGGLRIFDYTAGQPHGSSVALIEAPAGARHAEAFSRRSDKYYLVTEGTIRFVLDGVESMMSAGDFCFVEKGRRFRYDNPTSAPASLVLVHTPAFDLESEVFVEG
jgi:mannose-6-phosphate isomerase-like protein (cupin superfamily)